MKTKTRFHKLTAWLLTVAMLMTLVPGFTLSASAAECLGEGTASLYAVDFNLHIGGVQVDSTNMDDITTAINEEFGEEVAAGSASYDMFTNTLTLNDFSYMGEGDEIAAITHSGIGGDLNIHLIGENSVRLTDTHGYVIFSGGTISITAESDASLELSGILGSCSGKLELGEGLKKWDRKGEETDDHTADTYLYIAAESKGAVAKYALSIGGKTLTDAELCVLGEDGNGYAAYDPSSNTLTLKNYNLDFDEDECAIYYKGVDTLNIRLIGENTVTNTNTGDNSDGLFAMVSLTISGDGSLEVSGGYSGVFANDDITINGGEVDATGVNYGVFAGGSIEINGGKVKAKASATDGEGLSAMGNITITGGTVKAQGGYFGVCAVGDIEITGGTVEAQGVNFGVCAGDSIKISGGTTGASGGTAAFSAAPTIADGWAAYDSSDALIENPGWATLRDVTVKQNRTLTSTSPISVGDEYFVITGTDEDGNSTFDTIKGGNGTATLEVQDEYFAEPVYTLTLNNFTYSGPAADGIPAAIYMHAAYADRMTTFNLVLVGDSKITLMPGGYAEGYGLLTHYVDLTIVSGTGSLTLVVDGTYDDSKGVYIDGGNLTMESGSLTVVAGDASFDENYPDDPNDTGVSTGVYVARNLTMERGSITATGGEADIDSYGVYVGGNVNVTSGSVTATGGEADRDSCGVFLDSGDLIMEGGSITATGGEAEGTSVGVFLGSGNVNVTSGSVTATGGEAGYTSAGVYLNGDYDDAESGNLTVTNGSLTGTGGNATGTEDMPGMSAGIAAVSGSVTVTGGSVIGTGGEARDTYGVADEEDAFGIASGSGGIMAAEITVDGGSVTASGGSAEGTNAMSLGITAVYDLAINGGSVSASAGSVSGTDAISSGIYLYGTGFTMIGGTTVAQGETGALMVPFAENTINFENATVWYGASASEANGKEGILYTTALGDAVAFLEITGSKYIRIAERGSTLPVVTNYDVWVGGEQFTSELLTIDGDKGTATLTVDETDSATTYTLKLKDYEYIGAGHEGAAIYSEKPLTIVLDGENRVISYGSGVENSYCVNVTGDLTVTGAGTLTVIGDKNVSASYGVKAEDITVTGNVHLTAEGSAAWGSFDSFTTDGIFSVDGGEFVVGTPDEGKSITVLGKAHYAATSVDGDSHKIVCDCADGVDAAGEHIFNYTAEDNVLTGQCAMCDFEVTYTLTAPENAVYDGTEHEVTVTVEPAVSAGISVEYTPDNINAGIVTASLTMTGADGKSATATVTYIIACTITLNANGGSLSGSTTLTTDESGKLSSLPTPTRSGYTFNGWYDAETGGNKITTDTVFNGDTTVYAQWTVNQYTITFDVNGGSVAPASAIVTIPTAGTYTLVFANYEESRLSNIDIVTFTVTEDKVGVITVPSENGITLGTGDKIMLWNNMTDLVPLCEAYIVE